MNETVTPISAARQNIRDDDVAEFQRLSLLTGSEYDRVRKDEARRLGIQLKTLDAEVTKRRPKDHGDSAAGPSLALEDPEPWPEQVDGAALLDQLSATVERFLVLPDCAADAIALWVIHAHGHDSAFTSPLLVLTSPTPACGKTTLLALLGALVPRPLPASNITAAALFRAVEKWQPCLLVDEANTFMKQSDELRGIINSGQTRSGAFVVKTTGDEHEPKAFRTWAPKAIALIGKLQGDLASRAIHVELRRITATEKVERLRQDRMTQFEPLRRKAWRWAHDKEHLLRSADPEIPSFLFGRPEDNWRHMLAIADLAGGDWAERARRAAQVLSASTGSDETAGVMVLEDIRSLFGDRKEKRTPSTELVYALGAMEDRPWSDWKGGKPISAPQLARLLGPFKIKPSTIRFPNGVAKGYYLTDFKDAFARYLPSQTVTPLQPRETAGYSDFQTVTPETDVTVSTASKPAETNDCYGVTVQNPQEWGEGL